MSSNGKKTFLTKKRKRVNCIFSYNQSIFYRLVWQTRKNQGLFGKGLSFYCEGLKTLWKKGENAGTNIFSFLNARRRRDVLCDHPWRVGGFSHSLSGAYLQDSASYGYEISWVDRSHQGRVQCTGTITLACLIFVLLPFVYFHT